MARPRTRLISLKERLELLKAAALNAPAPLPQNPVAGREEEQVVPLATRIKAALNILKDKPVKATDMHCMIMYDIENDKVRREIAKYLLKQGCVRIQKSVYLASLRPEQFKSIFETLTEVQSYYDQVDSILLVPINISDARSMKIIGKDIQVETIIDPPNTLFF